MGKFGHKLSCYRFILIGFLMVSFSSFAGNDRLVYKFKKEGSSRVLFLSGTVHDVKSLDSEWVRYLYALLEKENVRTFFTEKLDSFVSDRNLEQRIIFTWLNQRIPGVLGQVNRNYQEVVRSHIRELTGIRSLVPSESERAKLIQATDQALASKKDQLILFRKQGEFLKKLTGITFGGVNPTVESENRANPVYENGNTEGPIPEVFRFALAVSGEAFEAGAEDISVAAHEVAQINFSADHKRRIRDFNFNLRNREIVEALDRYFEEAPEDSGVLSLIGLAHLSSKLGYPSVVDLMKGKGYVLVETVAIPGNQNYTLFDDPMGSMNRLAIQAQSHLDNNFQEAILDHLYRATVGLVALEVGKMGLEDAKRLETEVARSLLDVVQIEIRKGQFERAGKTLTGIQDWGLLKDESALKTWEDLKQQAGNLSSLKKKSCAQCEGRPDSLLACARCKAVFYCSKNCQLVHWKEHKMKCAAPGTALK